eukprot:g45014.t1
MWRSEPGLTDAAVVQHLRDLGWSWLDIGVRGAGAKRVERIRRSWGWTLKKASVTNPEKYTDPSRLKYLDESHFENWDCAGTTGFTYARRDLTTLHEQKYLNE